MPIGQEAVEKVLHLSRITPRPGEIDKFSTQLDAVLDYMAVLNQVNTDGVEPVGNIAGLRNVFREDELGESLPVDRVLANAPAEDGESFKVPKVF